MPKITFLESIKVTESIKISKKKEKPKYVSTTKIVSKPVTIDSEIILRTDGFLYLTDMILPMGAIISIKYDGVIERFNNTPIKRNT